MAVFLWGLWCRKITRVIGYKSGVHTQTFREYIITPSISLNLSWESWENVLTLRKKKLYQSKSSILPPYSCCPECSLCPSLWLLDAGCLLLWLVGCEESLLLAVVDLEPFLWRQWSWTSWGTSWVSPHALTSHWKLRGRKQSTQSTMVDSRPKVWHQVGAVQRKPRISILLTLIFFFFR